MGRIVIVAYKPKPDKNKELEALVKTHLDVLKSEELVTERDSIIMRAEDGTVIEVFEWKSKEVINAAHSNPKIQGMWKKFSEFCDYIPIADVQESGSLFPEFSPLN
ncbi:MAG: hypothetical protein WAN36_14730 [Calditrichia bacterium]